MIFTKTKLKDSFIIEIEKVNDERGFFGRTWDVKKFQELDINSKLVQCSVSFTEKKGTIRGMHFQDYPYKESKLVRCTRGRIFDVIVDIRPNSKTFRKWFGVELNSTNYKMIYVPEGFAHGFQTLENNTEVLYQISEFFMPEYAKGIRWDDPLIDIKWPLKPTVISKKDRNFELLK